MSQNLPNFAKFQKFQPQNLVDFEKCCKTRICLQRSAPIQPKTSEISPKFCQKLAPTLLRAGPGALGPARGARVAGHDGPALDLRDGGGDGGTCSMLNQAPGFDYNY